VSDKTGVVEFAQGLTELGVELVSTGGTSKELSGAGLQVRPIDDLTGFPEIMDGRVKTLNPKLYAGLLALRDNEEHLAQAAEHDIEYVDLVCVNLYPFEQTVARLDVPIAEAIENIDIGGPTMIRAAAKNYGFAAVVTSPASYDAVLAELRESDGRLSLGTREELAAEAFAYTARYDTAITRWFSERRGGFPDLMLRAYQKATDLPYGENPHQKAAFYEQVGARRGVLSRLRQLNGKQLSFNNVLDLDSARSIATEIAGDRAACVIVKHNNPCGAALGATSLDAYRGAFASDPVSAFGGIIVFTGAVDLQTAQALSEQFVEVVVSPEFSPEALELLSQKPNLRVLQDEERRLRATRELDIRQVDGGLLVQEQDTVVAEPDELEVVTEREPSLEEWRDLTFAWRVCRHVKSNAIVLARGEATIGIGAGQMSRVDSVKIAVERPWIEDREGLVLASDAFFPFADGPEAAMDGGVRAIIQPGGSVRDQEVIDAVNARGGTMVFTRRRHFRH
jgi:phosphoribosylaminoimidazolecarboxamide formyltransferase/IMP cyclohydrolase